jgi:hypothetical protein
MIAHQICAMVLTFAVIASLLLIFGAVQTWRKGRR